MKKITVLVLLVLTFGAFIYFYIDRGAVDLAEDNKVSDELLDKVDMPALNVKKPIENRVSPSPKPDSRPSHDLAHSIPLDAEERVPQIPIDSVRIKIIEEPNLVNESSLAEVDSNASDDGMPDSYSIEEAEQYYVPPEERAPGNLGGPPPLNLPNAGI